MPESDFSTRLRRLVETIDIANMLSTPILTSIRGLLESSAAAIGSADASVLIRDDDPRLRSATINTDDDERHAVAGVRAGAG